MGATRTQYPWHGPPGRAPSGISGPPGGTSLRRPRARLSPPEIRDVRPTRGTLQPARAPGRQVLQDAQLVAITVTEHPQSTSESDRLVPKRPPLPPVNFHPRKMILTAEDLFLQGPYLLLTARRTCQETQTRALLCKHCIFPNFETLPLHFTPRHPSPTPTVAALPAPH